MCRITRWVCGTYPGKNTILIHLHRDLSSSRLPHFPKHLPSLFHSLRIPARKTAGFPASLTAPASISLLCEYCLISFTCSMNIQINMGKVAVKIAINFVSVILAILVVSSQYESNCDHLQMRLLAERRQDKIRPVLPAPQNQPLQTVGDHGAIGH